MFLTSTSSDSDDVIHRSSKKIPTLGLKSTQPTKLKSDARGSVGKTGFYNTMVRVCLLAIPLNLVANYSYSGIQELLI